MAKSMNVKFVKLTDINAAINRKVNKDSDSFREFVDNVHAMGILSPIMLVKDPAGPEPWKVAFGGHRLTACRMLNEAGKTQLSDPNNDFSTIPAILSDMAPGELGFVQIVENLRTNKCSATEYANQLLRLMAQPEFNHLSRSEFMAKLGITASPAWLNNVLSLNDLLPEAIELVDAGKISISKAYDLALLDHNEQIDFLERAQTLNAADFKALVVNRRIELKKAAKGIKDDVPDPFADIKVRSKKELKERYVSLESRYNNQNTPDSEKTILLNRMEGLAFAMSIDAETRAIKDAEKAQEKAERDLLKKKRAEILAKMKEAAKEQVAAEMNKAKTPELVNA